MLGLKDSYQLIPVQMTLQYCYSSALNLIEKHSVAEEVATVITSGVAVVSCLGVSVISDHEGIVVFGLAGVGSDSRRGVVHSFADLGHGVVLKIVGVLLLSINCIKSLLSRIGEILCVVILLGEEGFTSQGVEHLTIIGVASNCDKGLG